ncbi:MAG: uracil-DNA glycosylase [Thermoproteota archaeon]|jgi:uracil-DNA glycosylase, family 4
MEKIIELKEIENKIKNCKLCPLSNYRKNAVPGEGSYETKIMFIGEAPGEEEDKQGRPFVGKAGQVLNEMLKEIGINRDEVFITNVVKCRPPNNREPSDEESKICISNYLIKQIELIKPAIIVLLGNVAIKQVLGINNPSKARSKEIIKDGIRYFCTYHPAVALYNPNMKEILKKEFEKIGNLYKNLSRNKSSSIMDYL